MGQFREVVIDFHPEFCGEEGEAFEQSLDVRVASLVTEKLHQLRIVFGKLAAQLPQVAQFFGKALFQTHGFLI
ncbi:hypothetical protein D3C81_798600 [compost metagenome]